MYCDQRSWLFCDITFYNREFLDAHPNIVVEKKSDSPNEDDSLVDSKALLPVLIDFFQKHPLINLKTFLGDAAFDTVEIYKALFGEIRFEKAFIPLWVKLFMEENGYTFNEDGIPCCPHNPSLPMRQAGSKSHLKSKLPTMKFVCPKMNRNTILRINPSAGLILAWSEVHLNGMRLIKSV